MPYRLRPGHRYLLIFPGLDADRHEDAFEEIRARLREAKQRCEDLFVAGGVKVVDITGAEVDVG